MARRHMKRCSALLIMREMQVKTTLRYHLIQIRMTIIKIPTNKCWRALERREPPYTTGRNVNWYSHYGEQYGGSVKN